MFRNRNLVVLDRIAFFLLVIGGLAWGIIGLFGFDFIAALFGEMSLFARIVYILIGAAAVYRIVVYFQTRGKIR